MGSLSCHSIRNSSWVLSEFMRKSLMTDRQTDRQTNSGALVKGFYFNLWVWQFKNDHFLKTHTKFHEFTTFYNRLFILLNSRTFTANLIIFTYKITIFMTHTYIYTRRYVWHIQYILTTLYATLVWSDGIILILS